MSSQADLDTIVEALVAQRIGDMAASLRAMQGEVEPYAPGEIYDYRRPEHVLAARGMHRVPAPDRPMEVAHSARKPLWQRRWVWLVTGSIAGIIALGMVVDAASAALGVSASTLIVTGAGAVVLGCLLSGRGGARGGSFTFHGTGRMNR